MSQATSQTTAPITTQPAEQPAAQPAALPVTQNGGIRYLRYLPAIYQEAPAILRDYLAPFEDWFDLLRDLLARIDTYLAPGMTPAAEFLPWLAGWVALTLDEEWSEDQRRRLISEAVELYRWRGTPTGLRRYLALYTGLEAHYIEIDEGQWPSGLQIGVASRIGGFSGGHSPAQVAGVRREEPAETRDYYVIAEQKTTGQATVRYIPVAAVEAVDFAGDTVVLRAGGVELLRCPLRDFTRRNSLPQTRYELALPDGEGAPLTYRGDGCIITAAPRPYSFIVRLLLPPEQYDSYTGPRQLRKLKAIVELEKPAHTVCYLDLQRRRRTARLAPMQIGVASTIGLDTIVPIRGDKEQL